MHYKKFLLPVFVMMLFNSKNFAQTNHWTVRAGENIKEALGDSVIYHYPQFMSGVVHYKNGTLSHASLNFNLVTGEMQFITPSKDTLAIANESSIDHITIQDDTFYYDKVYIQLIHDNSNAKLGKIEIIKQANIAKQGAYGQMNSTSAIDAIDSYYSSGQMYKLAETTTITMRKSIILFMGDKNNHFLPANKKNISKLFGKKNSTVESFIKENKIEFDKEHDLIKLVDYLGKM
jgi:hypothetical protein